MFVHCFPGFGLVSSYREVRTYDDHSGGEKIRFWVYQGMIYVSLNDFVTFVGGNECWKSPKQLRDVPWVMDEMILGGLSLLSPLNGPVVTLDCLLKVECAGLKEYYAGRERALQVSFYRWQQSVAKGYTKREARRAGRPLLKRSKCGMYVTDGIEYPSVFAGRVGRVVVSESNKIGIHDEEGELLMRGECSPSLQVEHANPGIFINCDTFSKWYRRKRGFPHPLPWVVNGFLGGWEIVGHMVLGGWEMKVVHFVWFNV